MNMLTVDQVAEYLNVSPASVRRMLREGQLPGAFKVMNTWRVPDDILRAYIKKQQTEAAKGE